MWEERGLDLPTDLTTRLPHSSSALDDVDHQLEQEMLPDARPGF